VIVAVNWRNIQRINTAVSMLEPDRIVYSFSNMREAANAQEIKVTAPKRIWSQNTKKLPRTVSIYDREAVVDDFLKTTRTTSLLVMKNGEILHEDYYLDTHQKDHRISWLVAKSFLSTLLGAAIDRGDIESVEDTIDKYAPEFIGTAYGGVSIRNVLNMSSGVVFDENYFDKNSDVSRMTYELFTFGSLDKFATRYKERDFEPGQFKRYVSIDTHVLGMVLRAATGKSLVENFESVLASKIGFSDGMYYTTDSKGVAYVLGGLNLQTRDYALLGQLYVQDGQWNGEQIISRAWIKDSTANSAPAEQEDYALGYGYQWWTPQASQEEGFTDDFMAIGFSGQFIYVNPAHDMVIVKTSAYPEYELEAPSAQDYYIETAELFRGFVKHYNK